MNLKEYYQKNVIPTLKEKFGYINIHAVPHITKVVVNVGLSKMSVKDKDYKTMVEESLKQITGQKPIPTTARVSIAGFGIREGLIIGEKVTLRGQKMYDFLAKVIHVALPRIRDFQGLNPKSLDKMGNLTLGFKEQTVFPETIQESTGVVHGLEMTIVTKAKNQQESFELFKLLKFPFQKK